MLSQMVLADERLIVTFRRELPEPYLACDCQTQVGIQDSSNDFHVVASDIQVGTGFEEDFQFALRTSVEEGQWREAKWYRKHKAV